VKTSGISWTVTCVESTESKSWPSSGVSRSGSVRQREGRTAKLRFLLARGRRGQKAGRIMKCLRVRVVGAVLVMLLGRPLPAADQPCWKAGTARANITPSQPLWMAGFGSRTKPAEGKEMDLWIKALALEDARGHRAIILSGDVLGFPQSIYQHTCAALKEKFALEPDQVLLAASHTHCGPVLRNALYDVYPLDAAQIGMIEKYSEDLEVKMVEVVGKAIARAGARAVGGWTRRRRVRR